MGYDLLVAITFVVMTPVVFAGFVVFWVVNARDHEAVAEAWRRYGATRGLRYEPPTGEWPNRTAPVLASSSTAELADLRITTRGREAQVRTRLTSRPRSALLGTLALVIDEGGAGTLTVHGERPRGFAQRILSGDVRRALLGFRQRDRITLTYRRGRVTLEWPGGEQNDARLDEARRVADAIVRTIEAEFRAPATAAERKPAA